MGPQQRPKLEIYGDTLFVVVRTASLHDRKIHYGETHIFAGRGYVVTVRHGSITAYKKMRMIEPVEAQDDVGLTQHVAGRLVQKERGLASMQGVPKPTGGAFLFAKGRLRCWPRGHAEQLIECFYFASRVTKLISIPIADDHFGAGISLVAIESRLPARLINCFIRDVSFLRERPIRLIRSQRDRLLNMTTVPGVV